MEKLKLKHYAPYVLQSVKYRISENVFGEFDPEDLYDIMCNIRDYENYDLTNHYLMVLRPLSDLTKEIDYLGNGKKVVFAKTFMREHYLKLEKELRVTKNKPLIEFLDYGIVEKMIKYHFDIFNLIERGLAIDINTLTEK